MIKKLILFLISFYAISQFCHKQTDGFAMAKVSTLLLEQPSHSIKQLPSTPFRYLGKGGQAYVFVSDDNRYVLKLFRGSRLNILKILSRLFPLESYKRKLLDQENQLRQTLFSYCIAETHLKAETGLIGIHLSSNSSFDAPLILIDKLGIIHSLDPHIYPFIIQERAVLVKERIAQLMQAGKLAEAQSALANLQGLLEIREEKGIRDQDPNLTKNFGFCGDRAIQIDGGRFSFTFPFSNTKLETSRNELRKWIELNYPDLKEQL